MRAYGLQTTFTLHRPEEGDDYRRPTSHTRAGRSAKRAARREARNELRLLRADIDQLEA